MPFPAASRCCRPWAARPRSIARLSLKKMGVLEKFDVEMIGATAEAIDKAEDRELFREAMTQDRPRDAALASGQDPDPGA